MEETNIYKISKIRNYLATIPEPDHNITDKYNGMRLLEFVTRFKCFNIKYPYEDNRELFLIELQEKDCVTVCEMVDNICINAYIFDNNLTL